MGAVAVVLAVTAVAVSIARRLNLGSTLGLLVIGIVLLLFLLGLDIQPSRLWSMRGMIVGLGSAQYVLSALAIDGALLRSGVGSGQPVVIVGLALAMSSAAVA